VTHQLVVVTVEVGMGLSCRSPSYQGLLTLRGRTLVLEAKQAKQAKQVWK